MTLAWLADAPLFIDGEQVGAFYDAVVRPEGRRGKTVISLERYEGQKTSIGGSVGAEISVSKLIRTLLPFLDIKLTGQATGEYERSGSNTRGETIELHPIETPQRQILQLALHYLTNLPQRVRVVQCPEEAGWYDEAFIRTLPRGLVFIDFPPGTKFVPMAGEVDKGKVVTIFDQLGRKLDAPEKMPEPPDRAKCESKEKYDQQWKKYWDWFDANFKARIANEVVEEVIASGGRVRWIDYRVPLPNQWPLHLGICGRGEYDTGTFAYDLIKRGFNHGIRMVGTMKSGPALNVLAIFEK